MHRKVLIRCCLAILLHPDIIPLVIAYGDQIEGCPLRQFGEKGREDGQLLAPKSFCVGNKTELFVLDQSNHRIQVFSIPTGSFLRKWGSFGVEIHQFYELQDLEILGEELYVSDTNRRTNASSIRVYSATDPRGTLLRSIYPEPITFVDRKAQAPAEGADELDEDADDDPPPYLEHIRGASGLTIKGEELFVSDRHHGRIVVFSLLSGQLLRSFAARGRKEGQLSHPMKLYSCGHDDNQLYVVDHHNHRISVLDAKSGEFIRKFGKEVKVMKKNGKTRMVWDLPSPEAVVQHLHELYVCDSSKNQILVFSLDTAKMVRVISNPGSLCGQLLRPSDLLIHQDQLFVCDMQNHRIAIFE